MDSAKALFSSDITVGRSQVSDKKMDRIEKEDRTVGNPKWTYLTSYSTSSSDFVCVRACVRMRGSMGERTRKFENKRRLYYLRHVKTRGRVSSQQREDLLQRHQYFLCQRCHPPNGVDR